MSEELQLDQILQQARTNLCKECYLDQNCTHKVVQSTHKVAGGLYVRVGEWGLDIQTYKFPTDL